MREIRKQLSIIWEIDGADLKIYPKQVFNFVLFLIVISVVLRLAGKQVISDSLSLPITTNHHWLSIIEQVSEVWTTYQRYLLSGMINLFLYIAIGIFVLYLIFAWIIKICLRSWLFQKPCSLRCYLELKRRIEDRTESAMRSSDKYIRVIIFLLLLILLFEFFVLGNYPSSIINSDWLVLAGSLIVSALFFIDVYYLWKAIPSLNNCSFDGIRRFLILRLGNYLWFFGIMIILFQFIPVKIRGMYATAIYEPATKSLEDNLRQIEQSIRDDYRTNPQKSGYSDFEDWSNDLLLTANAAFIPENIFSGDPIIPIRRILVASLLVSFVAYFIVPLFILAKWRQAILFLVVTVAYFFLERFSENIIPQAFNIPSGSLITLLLFLTIVISNSYISDLILDHHSSEETLACLSCGRLIDTSDKYCKFCGANLSIVP